MDIKNLVERIKSSRYFKVSAIALGVIVIAAGGGAYYFLVYQPQIESEAAAAKQPVASKPKPAPAIPAAKPAGAQPAASSAPHKAPPIPQPAIAPVPGTATPSAAVPAPGKAAVLEKPKLPMKEVEPEKPHAVARPEKVSKPAAMDKADAKLDTQDMNRQVAPQEALSPATSSAAELEPEPEPAEPVLQRRGITPKYNDIMTPVLRGDREAVKQLLDLGWWVDKSGVDGITPLMAAVMNRDTQMVQLLLEHGAEPSAQALGIARKNKDASTASLLEQKGAR